MKNAHKACVVLTGMLLAGLLLVTAPRPRAANAPAGRLTVNGDGTVTDTVTGLVWQQATPSKGSWSYANTYCTSNAAGLPGSGWRLPSLTELQTIIDDSESSPAIDASAFPGTQADWYWTSSRYTPNAGFAWPVDFTAGATNAAPLGTVYWVRCLR